MTPPSNTIYWWRGCAARGGSSCSLSSAGRLVMALCFQQILEIPNFSPKNSLKMFLPHRQAPTCRATMGEWCWSWTALSSLNARGLACRTHASPMGTPALSLCRLIRRQNAAHPGPTCTRACLWAPNQTHTQPTAACIRPLSCGVVPKILMKISFTDAHIHAHGAPPRTVERATF